MGHVTLTLYYYVMPITIAITITITIAVTITIATSFIVTLMTIPLNILITTIIAILVIHLKGGALRRYGVVFYNSLWFRQVPGPFVLNPLDKTSEAGGLPLPATRWTPKCEKTYFPDSLSATKRTMGVNPTKPGS